MRQLFHTIKQHWSKYLIELIVIIGSILGAFALDEWNQENDRKIIYQNLLHSLGSSIKDDVQSLRQLSIAREQMFTRADSVLSKILIDDDKAIRQANEAYFIQTVFKDITNTIHSSIDQSSYQSLKISGYAGKLYGTDFEYLLNTYYRKGNELLQAEKQYNQKIESLEKNWEAKFLNQRQYFFNGVNYNAEGQNNFATQKEGSPALIAYSPETLFIYEEATIEQDLQIQTEQLVSIGDILIDMLEERRWSFSENERLRLSLLLTGFPGFNKQYVIHEGNISSETDFRIVTVHSEGFNNLHVQENGYIKFSHLGHGWTSPFVEIQILKGRVKQMDFTTYKELVVEIKSDIVEEVQLLIKDSKDGYTGNETKVKIKVSNTWEKHVIPLSLFSTANLESIIVPFGILFEGDSTQSVSIKTVYYQ